ncbi:MAG: cupin domain-containing protein [Methylococcaceae bacterium]|nr:cupin domain-containing protein [Methylococcaceae bacterium]
MLNITSIKTARAVLVMLTALFCINIPPLSAEEQSSLKRTILLEKKVALPSKNINAKTIRVTFPPAFKTPEHTHAGPGPRYVVKGKLKVIEGNRTNTYAAGEVFWESGHLMSVENVGEGAAELIIFELAPEH